MAAGMRQRTTAPVVANGVGQKSKSTEATSTSSSYSSLPSGFEMKGGLVVPTIFATIAVSIHLLNRAGILDPLLSSTTIAATKPYADFSSFYTNRYLLEHSLESTKLMHGVGTVGLVVLLLRTPPLAVALGIALLSGYAMFPLLRFMESGLVEMAIMMGVYLFLGQRFSGWRRTLLIPLFSYGCAWFAHFMFEGNKPATFIYPTYSLLGDLQMVWTMVTTQSVAF